VEIAKDVEEVLGFKPTLAQRGSLEDLKQEIWSKGSEKNHLA
jgi:hypothetical protein